MATNKLTPEQCKLIEDNVNLIYSYCIKHNLDIDEYFDVLAEALCVAIRRYDPERAKLSTFIYQCFSFKLGMEHRKTKTAGRDASRYNITLISLDCDILDPDGSHTSLEEFLTTGEDETAALDIQDLYDRCISTFPERYKKIARLSVKGYPGLEIAKMVGVSPTYVSCALYRIRSKFRNMLNLARR